MKITQVVNINVPMNLKIYCCQSCEASTGYIQIVITFMTIIFLAAIDFWHISNLPLIPMYNWLSVLANDNVMVTRAYTAWKGNCAF